MAGVSRLQYSTEIRLIRVMCTGRIDLSFVLRAFSNGADAVFIGGCHPGECNYMVHGNYHTLSMVHLCKKIMEHIGLNPERLRIDWCDAGEGLRFGKIMNEFGKRVKDLGPPGEGEGIPEDEIRSRLQEVLRLVPYIKLEKKDKLESHFDNIEEYNTLYSSDEIDQLFREAPSYYIDPDKCQACGICLKRCPVDAIIGGKNLIHVIDQEKCIKCGTCFESCPPRFGAVKKISEEPVPPPIPEAERTIVRKAKAN